MVVTWGPEHAGALARLVEAALPGEHLLADELLACCWEDPGVVLATDDGQGAVAAVTRSHGSTTTGWIRLLVVHPGARRRGLGRELVTAAEGWCRRAGAVTVGLGGSAPWYLWPGVDTTWTAGLCLAEACGYRLGDVALNLSCPTTFRAPEPPGVAVRRIISVEDEEAVLHWCTRHWPNWAPELDRAVEQGGAFGAFGHRDGRGGGDGPDAGVAGFACHSVQRAGWIGPMATRWGSGGTDDGVARHRPGTGSALLGAVCRDLMAAGYPDAQIAWVSNVSFYARTAGAAVARVFVAATRDPAPRA